MKINYIYIILLYVFFFGSCDYFVSKIQYTVLAKYGDHVLTKEEVLKDVDKELLKKDSVVIVKKYIRDWIRGKVLISKSQQNMTDQKAEEYAKLVKKYEEDLYTNYYMDVLARKFIDTITNEELQQYYQANKSKFILEEDIVRVRYVHTQKNSPNYNDVKLMINDMTSENRKYIDSLSIRFMPYFIHDSNWVSLQNVNKKIHDLDKDKIIRSISRNKIIEKPGATEGDKEGVFVIKFLEYIPYESIAPFPYVENTIHQILYNKKKKKYIKQLEQDLIKDAIEDNQLEIYYE